MAKCVPDHIVTEDQTNAFGNIRAVCRCARSPRSSQRQGERLGDWIRDVQDNGTPAVRSVANGLRNDLDAVTAGLTLDYSFCAVEGTVNRIKMLKRQMFGRANFDLLGKRILHPATTDQSR